MYVFVGRGVLKVLNMNTDEGAVKYNTHEAFQDGLYFWDLTGHVNCLRQADKWAVTLVLQQEHQHAWQRRLRHVQRL